MASALARRPHLQLANDVVIVRLVTHRSGFRPRPALGGAPTTAALTADCLRPTTTSSGLP
jgi:hypothetical protein